MMARRRSNKHLYFAKAGHLFMMSELLLRKWNVAMPEVDIGDDIFVVRDEKNVFIKAQVKSANVRRVGQRDEALVSTAMSQLRSDNGTLVYFFVFRLNNKWKPIIIERNELEKLHDEHSVGGQPNKRRKTLFLKFIFKNWTVSCDGHSFGRYINDWSEFNKQKRI